MRLLLLAAYLFLVPYLAIALPHDNGIVTVGEREFFVGEVTSSHKDDAWAFKLRHSPWLKVILDNEPYLLDQDFRIFHSGVPALDLIGELPSQLQENERLEDDPLYVANGHNVVSHGRVRMSIYPQNSSINYSVSCTRSGFELGELNICRVSVVYPYGTNVVLTANKYLPGRLPEISDNFEPIAARMIEIAVCLDVTNQSDAERPTDETDFLETNPKLLDCRILLSS